MPSYAGQRKETQLFQSQSRIRAENLIASITEKNPIASARLANTYWHDHLVRIGVRKG